MPFGYNNTIKNCNEEWRFFHNLRKAKCKQPQNDNLSENNEDCKKISGLINALDNRCFEAFKTHEQIEKQDFFNTLANIGPLPPR